MKRLLLNAIAACASVAMVGAELKTFSFSSGLTELSHGQAAVWGLGGGSANSASMTYYKGMLNYLNKENSYIKSATLTLFNPSDWKAEPRDVLYINILKGLDLDAGIDKHTYDSSPNQMDTSWGANALVKNTTVGSDNYKAHQGLKFDDAKNGSLLRAPDSSMPNNYTTAWQNGKSVVTENFDSAAERASMPGTWTDTKGPYGKGIDTSEVVIPFSETNLWMFERYLRWDIAENLVKEKASDPSKDSWMVGLGFAAECHYYFSNVCLNIEIGIKDPPPPPSAIPDSGSTLALMGVGLLSLVGIRRRFAR